MPIYKLMTLFRELPFLALAGIYYKYNQCHTTLGGLSSVCAKLEPASSKSNEILEICVLQKFTPHALHEELFCTCVPSKFIRLQVYNHFTYSIMQQLFFLHVLQYSFSYGLFCRTKTLKFNIFLPFEETCDR